MITIRRVRLTNWMPFRGEHVVEFEPKQIVGLVGTYDDNEAQSNRAGKSGFIEAIKWCLYGRSRAKRETDLIHDGAADTRVEVTLFDDEADAEAVVVRWRDAKNKGGLDLVGWEGARKAVTQDAIDKLIGLNGDEFEQTAYFNQGDIHQFMEAGPTDRKAMLLRWLQTTPWETHAGEAAAYLAELERERARLAGALAAVGAEGDALDRDAMVEAGKAVDAELAEYATTLRGLSSGKLRVELAIKELAKCATTLAEAKTLQHKADQLRAQRGQANAYAPRLRQVEEQLSNLTPWTKDQLDEVAAKRDRAVRTRTERNVEIRRLEAEIAAARKNMTGTCPLLGEPCDRIKLTKDYVPSRQAQIEELRAGVAKCDRAVARADEIAAEVDTARKLQAERELLNQKAKTAAALEDRIGDLERERAARLKKVTPNYEAELAKARVALQNFDDEIREVEAATADANRRRAELRAAYTAGLEREERRKAFAAAVERVERDVADAKYVAYMFGRNGIPSLELENSFGKVEDEANFVLSRLKTPFQIELQATRQLTDWEANCLACGWLYPRGTREHRCEACGTARDKKRRDELSLRILEGKAERQFFMDSGGGKLLLSVGLRLALSRLAQRQAASKWGVLFLDEVFGSLDTVNRASMVRLITRTLVRELGFGQVFLISHEPEVRDAVPDVLQVRRFPNRRSEVAWA